MLKSFYPLMVIVSLGLPVNGQPQESVDGDDTAESGFERIALSGFPKGDLRFCAYAGYLKSLLDEAPDTAFAQDAVQSLAEIEARLKISGDDALDKRSRRMARQIKKDLEYYSKLSVVGKREEGKRLLTRLCQAGQSVGSRSVFTTLGVASVLTSVVTLPIRFVAKFGIGAFRRKLTPRGLSYPELLGGNQGMVKWLPVLHQAARVAFYSGNPYLFSFYAVSALDIEASDLCRKKSGRVLGKDSVKFCHFYGALKNQEYRGVEVGGKAGVQVGKFFFEHFDFRKEGGFNSRICEKGVKAQFRLANRAKERLTPLVQNLKLGSAAEISIIPPYNGDCIALEVMGTSVEEKVMLEANLPAFVDGISVRYVDRFFAYPKTVPRLPVDPPLCQIIRAQKVDSAAHRDVQKERVFDVLKFTLNPSRFATPNFETVSVPEPLLRKASLKDEISKKVVAYIIAPHPAEVADFEAVRPAYEDLRKQVRQKTQELRRMFKASSVEACEKLEEEFGFELKAFTDLRERVAQYEVATRIEEFRIMNQEARSAQRKPFGLRKTLKLNWEIRNLETLNDIREALNAKDIAHLVLISHGQVNGKIVDGRLNELPHNAFQSVSPGLQSVSFFSCHTHAAKETYGLRDRLAENESYWKLRAIGVIDAAEMFEKENQAPVSALSETMVAMDQWMARFSEGAFRTQVVAGADLPRVSPPKTCQITLSDLQIASGAFHLKLNQNWIGTAYPESATLPTVFPCAWLKESGNNLFLEGSNIKSKNRLLEKALTLSVEGDLPGGRVLIDVKPNVLFRRPNEPNLTGAKYVW